VPKFVLVVLADAANDQGICWPCVATIAGAVGVSKRTVQRAIQLLINLELITAETSTAEALAALLEEVETNEARKKQQAEKGFDGLTWFVYRTLIDARIDKAEDVSRRIKAAFVEFPNWKHSENALRELRKQVTFAIYAELDDLDRVTALVDELFTLLEKADRI